MEVESMETQLKRSWFCTCGGTFDEEVGRYFPSEGTDGVSERYCCNCKSRTRMEWRVIENTDPDDELDPSSKFCFYCNELKEAVEVQDEYENYAYPVCNHCIEENK